MSYDAFISYSSKDAAEANAVRAALEADGVGCWIAPRDIHPGGEWPAAIMRGIGSSRVMVLVFSADANASTQIVREVERAVHRRMPVVVFKIDPTFPSGSFEYLVSVAQWQDASSRPLALHLAALVANVKGLLDKSAVGSAGQDRRSPIPPPPTPRLPRPLYLGIAGAAVALAAGVAVWVAWPHKTSDAPRTDPVPTSSVAPPVPAVAPLAPAPVPLPERLKGLAAGPVLRLAYESAPPPAAPGASRPHLQVGILGRRSGQAAFAALRDGDNLSSERDEYIVAARAVTPGWLYVFQVDSAGRVEWLFPKNGASPDYSAGANPLAAGQTAQVPSTESRRALTLDRTAGVEHVYFVYAAARWPDLEQALSRPNPPAVAVRGAGGEEGRAVAEPNGLGLRGPGGTSALAGPADVGLLFTAAGQPVRVAGGSDAAAEGELLVVERWFRHVP